MIVDPADCLHRVGVEVGMVNVEELLGVFCGSPVRRAEFVMTEMLQGIDRIEKIDVSTQLLSAINA